MTVATVSKTRFTPEELEALPNAVDFELVDGELVERKMGTESSFVAAIIVTILNNFIRGRNLGLVLGADCGYQCFPDAASKIRKPDVSFVCAGRLPNDRPPRGYTKIAPDLVVEVLSPGDLATEIEEKVGEYLAAGVKLIWIVSPTTKTVRILRPASASSRHPARFPKPTPSPAKTFCPVLNARSANSFKSDFALSTLLDTRLRYRDELHAVHQRRSSHCFTQCGADGCQPLNVFCKIDRNARKLRRHRATKSARPTFDNMLSPARAIAMSPHRLTTGTPIKARRAWSCGRCREMCRGKDRSDDKASDIPRAAETPRTQCDRVQRLGDRADGRGARRTVREELVSSSAPAQHSRPHPKDIVVHLAEIIEAAEGHEPISQRRQLVDRRARPSADRNTRTCAASGSFARCNLFRARPADREMDRSASHRLFPGPSCRDSRAR